VGGWVKIYMISELPTCPMISLFPTMTLRVPLRRGEFLVFDLEVEKYNAY
jgi:hypothetical protein